MVQASGDEVEVPPTLQALLAARLDQLDAPERSVLERGAVEGEVFHRGVVQALTPEEPRLTTQLTALVRKELIRPDRPLFAGERRIPLPPPPHARRGLRGPAEGGRGRSCTSGSPTGSRSTARSSSSSTSCSATTSSRPIATGRSWATPTRFGQRSAARAGEPLARAGSRAILRHDSPRSDSTCSSGRPGCFPTRTDTRGSRSTSAGRVSTRDTAWRRYRGWRGCRSRGGGRQPRCRARPPPRAAEPRARARCRLPKPRKASSASSPRRRFRCSRRPATSGGSRSRVVRF